MDQTTWGALALTLTILAGVYTWWAFRHRGARAGLRGAAVTLLPPAAYLTGTLRLLGRIVDAFVDWLTRLAFTPSVWIGFALLAVALVLLGVAGRIGPRGRPADARPSPGTPPAVDRSRGRGRPAIDDDLADVEAILRQRGIR